MDDTEQNMNYGEILQRSITPSLILIIPLAPVFYDSVNP